MSFQKFTLGLVAAFGLPWLLLIAVPFGTTRNIDAPEFDEDKDGRTGLYETASRTGRVANGSEVYGANGCYVCHTQVIRPTNAGNDLWRDAWAGQKNDDTKNGPRESNAFDYKGELIAHIGLTRNGPDLSNVGYRLEQAAAAAGVAPEDYVYQRLLTPRAILDNYDSTCPSQPQLFRPANAFGQTTEAYLDAEGNKLVPGKSAKALANYLLKLKKDDFIPDSINYSRD